MDLTPYEYANILNLGPAHTSKKIWIEGRIHNMKVQAKMCFIILRYQDNTLQTIALKSILKDSFKDLCALQSESLIQLYGTLNTIPESVGKVKSASYTDFELVIEHYVLASPAAKLPFSLEDANDAGNSYRNDVTLHTRLDNRYFDLRVPFNHAVFTIQSATTQLFRDYLLQNDFIEIHTPKLISTASEGGANVFGVKYFDKNAFLAQSPQLYKQMAINADFDRVFEVGPVFRAENCISHRHMCEFIGLDLEMAIAPNKNYTEIIHMLWNTLTHIFNGLNSKYKSKLELIQSKAPFDNLVYSAEPLIISFEDGIKMLVKAGFLQNFDDDLSTVNEKELGKLVKTEFGSDIFVLNKYPLKVRPFYTMPAEPNKEENENKDKPNIQYSNSYDIIMRGEEICSGAQRIHDYTLLQKQLESRELSTKGLEHYLKSFTLGSKRHGGGGFGLERIVMLFLNLGNIRRASLFPRDPARIEP
jgi:aspartyl-tRNA synthetase